MVSFSIWPYELPGEVWSPRPESSQTIDEPGTGTALAVTDVSKPTLTRFDPPPGQAHGGGVLVLPGGAFRFLVVDKEGSEVADWFCARGFVAFVLKYRVVNSEPAELEDCLEKRDWWRAMEVMDAGRKVATQDAVRSVSYLRENAASFGLDPTRIGMIGFSAGAITTMGAVLDPLRDNRPDFAMPIYGAMPSLPVPNDAPPLFLVHARDDALVPVERSFEIAAAWNAAGAPAELHAYDKGGHGFGMRALGLPVDHWPQALDRWLSDLHPR